VYYGRCVSCALYALTPLLALTALVTLRPRWFRHIDGGMNDFRKALEREVADLESALQAHPIYVRLVKAKELLAAYGTAPPQRVTQDGVPPPVRSKLTRVRKKVKTRKVGEKSKKERVLDAVTEMIRNGATHRKVILDRLTIQGLMGSEANPMQQLAGYLSEEKTRFRSAGDGNWKLTPEAEDALRDVDEAKAS
jgi:hypothetical protein